MKTLDEVIKFFEKQEAIDKWEPRTAALHYLKEYRAEMDNIRIFHDDHIAMKNELSDIKSSNNPALTWDELKQMEGKPVWIEAESLSVGVSPYWKDWYIIESFSDDEFMHCNDGYEWAKETQGRLWKAYRKERS